MKVIDLLNKIANGEEVPTRIKYKNDFYEYAEWYQGYRNETKDDEDYEILLLNRLIEKQFGISFLNDEIEIIEEDKPIKELKLYTNYEILEDNIRTTREICFKINEIIDRLNNLEKKEGK